MSKLNDIIKELNTDLSNQEMETFTQRIRELTFTDMGFAKIDNHRKMRTGAGEVIYGKSKTVDQITQIISSMKENGEKNILITGLSQENYNIIKENTDLCYDPVSKLAVVGENNPKSGHGYILVVTAGTSDIPVAEEAAQTAEFLGNEVHRAYDCGVAGVHRLLAIEDEISNASVIIAIAGMEGALASVVGGLAKAPVVAVPTSIGYGASFNGLSALLSMLNSCASGVSVVNIDNGFGAGYMADMINHVGTER